MGVILTIAVLIMMLVEIVIVCITNGREKQFPRLTKAGQYILNGLFVTSIVSLILFEALGI